MAIDGRYSRRSAICSRSGLHVRWYCQEEVGYQLGLYGFLRFCYGSHLLDYLGIQDGLWVSTKMYRDFRPALLTQLAPNGATSLWSENQVLFCQWTGAFVHPHFLPQTKHKTTTKLP